MLLLPSNIISHLDAMNMLLVVIKHSLIQIYEDLSDLLKGFVTYTPIHFLNKY